MKQQVCCVKKCGFTLVEMLIALVIIAMISVMVAFIFRATQQSFAHARAFQHVIDLARQTITRMHQEISSAFVDHSGIIHFIGTDAGAAQLKADSQGDELFFVFPAAGNAEGDIAEVGYWQRSDGTLMRHLETDPDFDFSTYREESELGLIVSHLNFSYYDGTTYYDSWDTRRGAAQEGVFPKIVRVSFSVSDEKHTTLKEFKTTVRIASSYR